MTDNGLFSESVFNNDPQEETPPEFIRETIAEHYGDAELQKQFQLEMGEDCIYFPMRQGNFFLCSCGTVNKIGQRCESCDRRYEDLIYNVELESLGKKRDARLEKEAEEARLAAEEAERQLRRKKRKLIIIPAVAAVVVLLAVLIPTVIIPSVEAKKQAQAEAEALRMMYPLLHGLACAGS